MNGLNGISYSRLSKKVAARLASSVVYAAVAHAQARISRARQDFRELVFSTLALLNAHLPGVTYVVSLHDTIRHCDRQVLERRSPSSRR